MDLNYVRFDVGHYLAVCHKSTLLKYENSVLAKFVQPEFDRRNSGSDYITIDRDGKHFGSILNFMRDNTSLDLSQWSDQDLADLMREADFYCLTELVELCESEFELRDRDRNKCDTSEYIVPPSDKLEIVLGLEAGRELLKSIQRKAFVISYYNIRKYNIDHWIEQLVKVCNHKKYHVYSIADKSPSEICDQSPKLSLKDFLVALYDPIENRFILWVSAPPYEKFRNRRAHYKCKIFKFWFLCHQEMTDQINKRQNV